MGLSLGKHFLKREAVNTRHPHIRHSTVYLIKTWIVEELVRRRKRSHFHPGGFDRARQRTAHRLIVIDNGDFHGMLPFRDSNQPVRGVSSSAGSSNSIVAPRSAFC